MYYLKYAWQIIRQKELIVKTKGNQQEAWHGKNMDIPLHKYMIALRRVTIQRKSQISCLEHANAVFNSSRL